MQYSLLLLWKWTYFAFEMVHVFFFMHKYDITFFSTCILLSLGKLQLVILRWLYSKRCKIWYGIHPIVSMLEVQIEVIKLLFWTCIFTKGHCGSADVHLSNRVFLKWICEYKSMSLCIYLHYLKIMSYIYFWNPHEILDYDLLVK